MSGMGGDVAASTDGQLRVSGDQKERLFHDRLGGRRGDRHAAASGEKRSLR